MSSPAAPTTDKPEAAPSGKAAVVKKYANRRLYNTATSSYVTLDELSQMVRKGDDFVVYDAKTNEDITRSVLTQIILEEDSKGRNLLPIGFLRQLISFYDDNLHAFLPRYLEMSMENFSKHQDQIRAYMEQTFGRFFPINQFEDMARQNLAIFQRAASIWNPATGEATASANGADPAGSGHKAGPAPGDDSPSLDRQMRELRERMESLQAQLSDLQTRGR
ncbi:MAG: polyhydroxyalkanoate synthesis repressor PhaR [Geminicoccaceae bacterium]